MSVDQEPVMFNPLQEGYIENPWPHLAELRAADPVHRLFTGQWGLFRHDDIFTLLRDPSLSVDDVNANLDEMAQTAMFEEHARDLEPDRSILNIDPPDHTRLRRLVSQAFTPRTIETLRPMVQQLVDDALNAMAAAGQADLVSGLAFPLPFDVISEMLGMPASDKIQIRDWSAAIVKTIDPVITEDEVIAAAEASRNMNGLIAEVIEWKRANPADDLLTALIDAEEDGDRMSASELRDQVALLFIAGHETTVNLIGTGIYELLRHPGQLARLAFDPALVPAAVEELLRYVAPVQITRRIATSDLEIRGRQIPKGSFVLCSLASANRDPDFWGADAEELNLGRANSSQHVSFGSGVHYCLGASLAKLEAETAIGSFVRRFARAHVVGEPEWNGRINLRGLEKLELGLS